MHTKQYDRVNKSQDWLCWQDWMSSLVVFLLFINSLFCGEWERLRCVAPVQLAEKILQTRDALSQLNCYETLSPLTCPRLYLPTPACVGSYRKMMSSTASPTSSTRSSLKKTSHTLWTPVDCNPVQPGETGLSGCRELNSDSFEIPEGVIWSSDTPRRRKGCRGARIPPSPSVCWKRYHGEPLDLVTAADARGEERERGLVTYLFTTRLRVLWEPFTRQIASCLKPLRGISLMLTSSSPTWRHTAAALLPSSTWNTNTAGGGEENH